MEKRLLKPVVHGLPWPELASGGEEALPFLLRRLWERPGLVVLDSAGGSPRSWSILGFDPFCSFGVGLPGVAREEPRTLDELAALLECVALDPEFTEGSRAAGQDPGPFAGGFLGALSYELGVRGDPLDLPGPAWSQPLIVGGLYRDWIVVEHDARGDGVASVRLVVSEDSTEGDAAAAKAAARASAVLGALRAAHGGHRDPGAQAPATPHARGERTISSGQHRARVAAVRDYIRRGEVYQANISHRIVSTAPIDPLELYLRLRQTNPAPYMGFLRFDSGEDRCALLSSSPELLLDLEVEGRGQRVARTRPIKGTIARGSTPEEDACSRETLLASEKDLAELAMIVDLERNDLGRIATPGGVHVGPFPEVETYAAVHHLVADVTADVADDRSAMDVVAALFPGGSITGAPKLRSMEIIAKLEEEGRGFFTGSMGLIDLRGRVALSILIRTMIHRVHGGEAAVSFHVGGGITWNSDPAHEDDETLWKAAGMLRALSPGGVSSPVDCTMG